jgi:Sensors of blue-light using FAD
MYRALRTFASRTSCCSIDRFGTLTDSILRKALAWNTQNDITGVFCEGQGVFLQALEGERSG